MKTFISSCIALGITALIVGACVFFWGLTQFQGKGPLAQEKIIKIERGSSVQKIAGQLSYENIIENPLVFKIGTRLYGTQSRLHAGEYMFPAKISPHDVMQMMVDGKTFHYAITIAEGLTTAEIVARLNAEEKLTGKIETLPPEGSLLPETYHYSTGDDRNEILKHMQDAMDETLRSLCDTGRCAPPPPINSMKEAVVLASIVEKETGVASERSRVAGVFYNRLRIGMPLQSDPTAIYAITKGKAPLGRKLYTKDLQIDSPYNTYKYPGLPPGPIANPGKAALQAVFAPEAHDYLYFVADGSGGHAFAKTLTEHNKNVAAWRKLNK